MSSPQTLNPQPGTEIEIRRRWLKRGTDSIELIFALDGVTPRLYVQPHGGPRCEVTGPDRDALLQMIVALNTRFE